MSKEEIIKWTFQTIQSLGLPALLLAAIAFLLKDKFSSIEREASLKADVKHLQEEHSDLKNEIVEFKKENLQLKEQTSEKSHKDKLLSEFIVSKITSIAVHKQTEELCCTKCLYDKGQKVTLRIGYDGWRCPVCKEFYAKADIQPPDEIRGDRRH